MKTCFKCGAEKPVSEFYRHPQMGDGHLGKCKECTKTDVHNDYIAKRPAKAAYDRKREQTQERKAQKYATQVRRRERAPMKYAAHNAVSNAVRTGQLLRQSCETCGNVKSQAHHDDYSKPLDVKWLCFKHHRELHGQTIRT